MWKTNLLSFIENSSILVVNDIESTLNELIPQYPLHSTRIIKNEEKDEFQIAQATQAIKEAYIASNDKKYILQYNIYPLFLQAMRFHFIIRSGYG